MHELGPWWSFGDLCWKFFRGLDWTYEHMSPNKIFIVVLFICFFWWLKLQNDYNKKAEKNGTYK